MDVVIGLFTIFRRHTRLLAVVFLVATAMVTAGVYVKRVYYESTAKILINMEGRGISLSRADVQYGNTMVQAVEAMTSQVEILKSRELLEEVVDKLGLDTFRDPPPSNPIVRLVTGAIGAVAETASETLVLLRLVEPISPRDALIGRLQNALQVYPVRQAQIIVLGLRWRRPDIPPLVLRALIDTYLRRVGELNGFSDAQVIFLEQARRSNTELGEAEKALRDYEMRYGITDLRREKQNLVERIDRLTSSIEGIMPGAAGAAAAAGPPKADVGAAESGAAGGQIGQLRGTLNALKIERAKLLVSHTSETRAVRELNSQIAEISDLLARETQEINEIVVQLRARLRLLQEVESGHDALTRDVEIAREAYQTYRKVSEDRRVMMAQEARVRVQVIDPPSLPFLPVGPSRLIMLLAGIAGSLVLALLAVLAVDFVQSEFRRRRRARARSSDEPSPVAPPSMSIIAHPASIRS